MKIFWEKNSSAQTISDKFLTSLETKTEYRTADLTAAASAKDQQEAQCDQ